MRSSDFDDTGSFPLRDGKPRPVVGAPIRLALADRHRLVLEGLEEVLKLETDLVVTASTDDSGVAVQLASTTVADILIVDPSMFDDPIGVLRGLTRSEVRIIVFTSVVDEDDAIVLIRAGVRGVVLKHMSSSQLLSCIRRVARGQIWIEKSAVARALERILKQEAHAQRVDDLLSVREADVLRLAAQGMRNHAIGSRLGIDESAVRGHLHAVYEKLNIRSRGELADFARTRGLVI